MARRPTVFLSNDPEIRAHVLAFVRELGNGAAHRGGDRAGGQVVMRASDSFAGGLADPGQPFAGRVFVPYRQRSLVLIGANGYGKTRLLNAIADPGTARVFRWLPPRLMPYLTAACPRAEAGEAIEGPSDVAELYQLGEATLVALRRARVAGGSPGRARAPVDRPVGGP